MINLKPQDKTAGDRRGKHGRAEATEAGQPILKPLSGAEPDLYEALA